MINVKLLKKYMNRNGTMTFATLAEEVGTDPAELQAFIAAADMPISLAERIATVLEIPSPEWPTVFFAEPIALQLAPSDYSIRISPLAETEILDCFQSDNIAGDHNILDELLVSWQLSRSYPDATPVHLKRAENAAAAAMQVDANAEAAIAGLEDAATMHGFALGVQFAVMVMKNDGAIWSMLRHELKV